MSRDEWVKTVKRMNSVRWTLVEIWDDLHYPPRRQTLRDTLCRLNIFHYPITFWDAVGGYDSPPEAHWACERCGKLRLPYRAWLWSTPLGRWVR